MSPSLLFDARLALAKPTGIGQYIASLLPEMVRLAPDWHFHLLRQSGSWPDYGLASLQAPNLTHHLSDAPPMSLRQQVDLPRLAQQLAVNLVHYPHFDAPVFWQPTPVVATIHDAKYLVEPAFFRSLGAAKRAYMRWMFGQTLRRAAATIVVSQHTTHDLARLFAIPTARMKVIYEAANPRFRPADEAAITNLRRRYALPRPYILSVGERRPHKNFARLITAYAASQARQHYDLVIIGQPYQTYTEPEALVAQHGLHQYVHLLSSVSDEDLVAFYSGAMIFALPSLYEGFGLPILEAMACGAPVITSATTSAGEIAGDAALLVDPTDCTAIAAALDELILQPQRREALVRRGAARNHQFTWQRAAEQTLSIYRQIVGAGGVRLWL
jgi:glycosyltransferase involved in cell wall biosynthesis